MTAKAPAVGCAARIDKLLNRYSAGGLAVGVIRNGELEFFTGRGVADTTSKVPVTVDTVFRIGSISKTFTALAVMRLVE
jgi:CubicO group peptidase (beta-lactamase class C family)